MLQADVGADHALELGERLACTEPALERCRVAGRGGQPSSLPVAPAADSEPERFTGSARNRVRRWRLRMR